MSAILFGSISSVADTSELQREAFNQAFRESGLGWTWEGEDYRSMLGTAGGKERIAAYAEKRGEDVDAEAVHATKSRIFQESLASSGVSARNGVVETIKAAKDQGLKVGLVTTTSPENVTALLSALSPQVSAGDFDVVVDRTSVQQPKPDAAAYAFALLSLGEEQGDCVAIEDNLDGVRAANAAGVACVAFPNENTAGQDFATAARRVDHVDVDELTQLIAS